MHLFREEKLTWTASKRSCSKNTNGSTPELTKTEKGMSDRPLFLFFYYRPASNFTFSANSFLLLTSFLVSLAVLLRILSNPVGNVFQKQLTARGNNPLVVNFLTYLLLSVVCIV